MQKSQWLWLPFAQVPSRYLRPAQLRSHLFNR